MRERFHRHELVSEIARRMLFLCFSPLHDPVDTHANQDRHNYKQGYHDVHLRLETKIADLCSAALDDSGKYELMTRRVCSTSNPCRNSLFSNPPSVMVGMIAICSSLEMRLISDRSFSISPASHWLTFSPYISRFRQVFKSFGSIVIVHPSP